MGTSRPTAAGLLAVRIGMADSDALQQQTAWHPPASDMDAQAAIASPRISDAPTNAPRAIAVIRSLLKAMGMVSGRKGLSCEFDTPAQFILGAQRFEDKPKVPFASDGAVGSCTTTYLFV